MQGPQLKGGGGATGRPRSNGRWTRRNEATSYQPRYCVARERAQITPGAGWKTATRSAALLTEPRCANGDYFGWQRRLVQRSRLTQLFERWRESAMKGAARMKHPRSSPPRYQCGFFRTEGNKKETRRWQKCHVYEPLLPSLSASQRKTCTIFPCVSDSIRPVD